MASAFKATTPGKLSHRIAKSWSGSKRETPIKGPLSARTEHDAHLRELAAKLADVKRAPKHK